MNNQLDLFSFTQPVVAATKAPVVIETNVKPTPNLWAKAMAIPVMVLAALASGENGRRPNFLPQGQLLGAAALVADAYGIGMCNSLGIDPELENTYSSPLVVATGKAEITNYKIVIESSGGE